MKKISSLTIIAAVIMLIMTAVCSAANVEDSGKNGLVAWDQGVIEALGTGLPPANAMTPAQGRALARRAAITDAYRNLAEAIQGVQVDSQTVMSNLTISSDIVKVKVQGLIRGAKIVREQQLADGTYQIVMRISLYGRDSLASVALNAVKPERVQEFPEPVFSQIQSAGIAEIPASAVKSPAVPAAVAVSAVPATVPAVSAAPVVSAAVPVVAAAAPAVSATAPAASTAPAVPQFTGVIINAQGLGLEPTFSPRVYDETGRIVYGNMYLDVTYAINEGMVEYSLTPEMASAAEKGQSRAGAKPLIIKALRVVDENNANLVISNADANLMLAANQAGGFLKKCAVVFER